MLSEVCQNLSACNWCKFNPIWERQILESKEKKQCYMFLV